MKFLGYVFSWRSIGTDEEKLNAIQDFSEPRSVKHLQSFLGFVNYYSLFTAKYAASTRPLYQLFPQKEKKWEWNEEMKAPFQDIMNLFKELVVIA